MKKPFCVLFWYNEQFFSLILFPDLLYFQPENDSTSTEQPHVVGYLIIGIVVGPHVAELITDQTLMEISKKLISTWIARSRMQLYNNEADAT